MNTSEDHVKAVYPDAAVYGFGHGKVRIESPTCGILSDMKYLGTREKRRSDAWEDAARRLPLPFEPPMGQS